MKLPDKLLKDIQDSIDTFEEVSKLEGLAASDISPEYKVPNWVVALCSNIKTLCVGVSKHSNQLTIKILVYTYTFHERLLASEEKPFFMEVDSLAQMYARIAVDPKALSHLISEMNKYEAT